MVKNSTQTNNTSPSSSTKLLDYKQVAASNNFLPQPPKISSSGWHNIHLELHQQPKFEIPEHQHNMHVIALGFSNSLGERWLDGKMQPETRDRGSVGIIPSGITHRCNWNDFGEFGILAVEPALLKQVSQDFVDGDRLTLVPQFMNEPDELIQGIFLTLKDELESHKIAGSLLIDSLQTTLAIHLIRKYCTTKPKLFSYQHGLSKQKFRQVAEYINEHLDEELKVIELATIAQISPYHFIRLFKQSTNKTPHQYILHQRIKKAKYLLQHSSISISKIAVTVGFCDQSHFSKYFKRVVGVTPRQYLGRVIN